MIEDNEIPLWQQKKRCKHDLIVGTCATCLGTDRVPVPDPFEGVSVEELDPERDLGGK